MNCYCIVVDYTLKSSISLEGYQFHLEMPSSKQKNCITNCTEKSEKDQDMKIKEEQLPTLPANE